MTTEHLEKSVVQLSRIRDILLDNPIRPPGFDARLDRVCDQIDELIAEIDRKDSGSQ